MAHLKQHKKSFIVEDYTTERGARRRSFDATDEQIGGAGELRFAKKREHGNPFCFKPERSK